MKHLVIESHHYNYLLNNFEEWLQISGYHQMSVINSTSNTREFFYWLEQHHIKNITAVTGYDVEQYYKHIKYRSNQKKYGALSLRSLNGHINSLRRLKTYLKNSAKHILSVPLQFETIITEAPEILTIEEVKALYKATENYEPRSEKEEAIGARDRAMLTLFYGCGLRRNEGVHVDTSDINFDKGHIHVRKGKRRKERFVPLTDNSLNYLKEYIYGERQKLIKDNRVSALLLSIREQRIYGQSLLLRLRILQERCDSVELREKQIGLHLLRHSIATHLLHSGMSLEEVSQFLGHDSLESTQIYTRVE